ncbi:MAG: FixH family protein [Armatimonadetes bacterium]|nr:FixH family protein [Armatimonadota bacterium]
MMSARGCGLLLAMALALAPTLLRVPASVEAHGKQVNIAVTCVTPDPGRPLTKVCTAFLKYLDGDPVTGGKVQVTATREGKAEPPLAPVRFTPLKEEGLYSATVTFPAYGRWRITFAVREPGRGEAEVREEFLPPVPGASPEIRSQLQIVFDFGLADVLNIAARVVHLLATAAWLALSALVLVATWLIPPEQRWSLLHRLAKGYPWIAGGSLLAVIASGLYNARYNVPTRSPGLFAPRVFQGLPFGEAYLLAFFAKMGLAAAILVVTIALGMALRRAYDQRPPAVAGGGPGSPATGNLRSGHLTRLAVSNVVLGLLMLANVVVLAHLHIISHVGAAAAGR